MDYEVTQDDGSSEQRTLTGGRANGRRWLTTSRLQNAEINDLDDVKRRVCVGSTRGMNELLVCLACVGRAAWVWLVGVLGEVSFVWYFIRSMHEAKATAKRLHYMESSC
eukprot:scaffold6396_cov175-Alexandrium_tamarense.AAC.1